MVRNERWNRIGHQLIDWIADYRAGIAARPVMARTSPGEVKAQLPASSPEHPEGFEHGLWLHVDAALAGSAMLQRIQHEMAFQAAKQALAVVAEAIHPYVHRDAFEEFYEIIKEALRTYQDR